MRRREFVALMGASVAWPFAAIAQEPGRTYRLGCLLSGPRNTPQYGVLFEELRRRGFIEGQNLTVEYRAYAVGHGRCAVGQSECWWRYLTAYRRWRWLGHTHGNHWCH